MSKSNAASDPSIIFATASVLWCSGPWVNKNIKQEQINSKRKNSECKLNGLFAARAFRVLFVCLSVCCCWLPLCASFFLPTLRRSCQFLFLFFIFLSDEGTKRKMWILWYLFTFSFQRCIQSWVQTVRQETGSLSQSKWLIVHPSGVHWTCAEHALNMRWTYALNMRWTCAEHALNWFLPYPNLPRTRLATWFDTHSLPLGSFALLRNRRFTFSVKYIIPLKTHAIKQRSNLRQEWHSFEQIYRLSAAANYAIKNTILMTIDSN